MRISHLSLEGLGAWTDLQLESLSPELNVFVSESHGGKSTLARLVAHLLYGKADNAWRLQLGQTLPLTEGSLTVQRDAETFVLRRRRGGSGSSRLTIASTEGALVDAKDAHRLIGDLPPRLAAQLFAVDFAEAPRAEALLSEPFAREFTSHLHADSAEIGRPCVDRRRVDELIQQRNSIARQIEEQMQIGRRESEVLDRESSELDARLTGLREQAEGLRARLAALDARRAELTARARYYSLEAHSTTAQVDTSEMDRRLHELEGEITRCRQSLGDLQTRSVALRTELAQISPDGTSDRASSLTDGRTTLVVLERLLDDLDAEVAQLARAHQPGRGAAIDSHARFSPLAALLRQQVYSLCGHWSEQERAVRRGQLSTEMRQVERALTDLGERLELLLGRREAVVAEVNAARRPVLHYPQAPATDYCRCEHHGQFVQHARGCERGEELERELAQVEHERAAVADELATVHRDVARAESEWKRIQQERAGLVTGALIEANRAELVRLESLLQQALGARIHEPRRLSQKHWRASDVLAQLTAGRLVQIRLDRGDAHATIIDNTGRSVRVEELSHAEHDQLLIALTLALASAYASRGYQLPLILDEPFLRLDPAAVGIMAGVLEEFSRAGHQVLVFTEDLAARRMFESLHARVFNLDTVRRVREPQGPVARHVPRLVRETVDGKHSAGLRIASGHGEGDIEAVFYLSAASGLNEFPVLGSATASIFSRLGIHTVGDLLDADPDDLARRLERSDILPGTVRLWQSHMDLLCHVPELTLNDAQVLTACGINSPKELREADVRQLSDNVDAFLDSNVGLRFAESRQRYTRGRIADWIYAAGGVRESRPTQKRRRKAKPRSPRLQQ